MLDSHAGPSAEILLERQRLARDLHDTVAQSLAALGYGLDEVVGDESLTSKSRKALRSHRLELSRIVADLRDEIHRLRSPRIERLFDWLSPRTNVELEADLRFKSLPEEPELAHLLLELFNNAANHQGITHAKIICENGTIAANFVGYSTSVTRAKPDQMKLGRTGIKERLEILGASLESTDSGFLLRLGSDNG